MSRSPIGVSPQSPTAGSSPAANEVMCKLLWIMDRECRALAYFRKCEPKIRVTIQSVSRQLQLSMERGCFVLAPHCVLIRAFTPRTGRLHPGIAFQSEPLGKAMNKTATSPEQRKQTGAGDQYCGRWLWHGVRYRPQDGILLPVLQIGVTGNVSRRAVVPYTQGRGG